MALIVLGIIAVVGAIIVLSQYRFYFLRSSDYFVGSSQDMGWNRYSDLLGCFQIDHQLELCRLLHRKSAGLTPFRILST